MRCGWFDMTNLFRCADCDPGDAPSDDQRSVAKLVESFSLQEFENVATGRKSSRVSPQGNG
jgi:hypothetical protein